MKTIDIQTLETITGGNTTGGITGPIGEELGRRAGEAAGELGRRAGGLFEQLKRLPTPTFPVPSPTFPVPGGNRWDRLFNGR